MSHWRVIPKFGFFGKGQNSSILKPKVHFLHQKYDFGQFFTELAQSISILSRVTVQKGIKKGQHLFQIHFPDKDTEICASDRPFIHKKHLPCSCCKSMSNNVFTFILYDKRSPHNDNPQNFKPFWGSELSKLFYINFSISFQGQRVSNRLREAVGSSSILPEHFLSGTDGDGI